MMFDLRNEQKEGERMMLWKSKKERRKSELESMVVWGMVEDGKEKDDEDVK